MPLKMPEKEFERKKDIGFVDDGYIFFTLLVEDGCSRGHRETNGYYQDSVFCDCRFYFREDGIRRHQISYRYLRNYLSAMSANIPLPTF